MKLNTIYFIKFTNSSHIQILLVQILSYIIHEPKKWKIGVVSYPRPPDSIKKKTFHWLASKHMFTSTSNWHGMHPQLIGERPIRNFLATEIATNTPLPLLLPSLLKNWSWDFPFALELFSRIARLIEMSSNQQKMPPKVEARKIRIKEAAPPSHCELTSSQLIETLWSENWETLPRKRNEKRFSKKSKILRESRWFLLLVN